MRRVLLFATMLGVLLAPASATAATLGFSGGVLSYVGVDGPESVSVESINVGVKFYNLAAGQITAPLPSGCTATNPANGQIVTCTMAGIDSVAVQLGAGDDTLIANGLSKPMEIHGGAGRDSITSGSAAASIWGDGDVDTIQSGAAVDSIYVRDGLADTVNCGGNVDNLQGDTVDVFTGCETRDISDAQVADADGDGYKPPADCNDADPAIHPGAYDTPGDGIDQDCSGADAKVAVTPTPLPTPTPKVVVATPTPTPVVKTAPTPTPTPTPAAAAGAGSAAAGKTGASATGTITSSGLPQVAALPRIDFAVVTKRRYTRATKVTVDAVASGATVRITCKGKAFGCPARGYRKTFKNGIQHLVVRSVFQLARLRAGARLDVRVTLPGAVGRSVRYRVNRGAKPDSEVRCLSPGTGKVMACPG